MTDTALTDRPAKRVLAVGATQSVLDLVSDPTSRFGGMARDMLRALLVEQYLLSVCRGCGSPNARLVYWMESDHTRMADPDNTGRESVFLCDPCSATQQSCAHCDDFNPLFDAAVPADKRPPVFVLANGGTESRIAAQCVEEVMHPRNIVCSACGARSWLRRLFMDGPSQSVVCVRCVKARGLAPCIGQITPAGHVMHCHKLISARRACCDACRHHRPDARGLVWRCSRPACFELAPEDGAMCVICELVHGPRAH